VSVRRASLLIFIDCCCVTIFLPDRVTSICEGCHIPSTFQEFHGSACLAIVIKTHYRGFSYSADSEEKERETEKKSQNKKERNGRKEENNKQPTKNEEEINNE